MTGLTYSPKVLDLMRNPKNMGEIKKPDGVATVGNPVCGDVMRLYIRVGSKESGVGRKKEDYIKEIKFQTLGCAAAIASSSILTEMAKGKLLEEAGKITDQQVAKELGGLPEVKLHCSVLASQALKKAISDYRKKKRVKL